MIDQSQIDLAKIFWEQSRTSALLAHEAWGNVIKSQKTLMDSMRGLGMPFALASDQFSKMMEFHDLQYKAALEHMDQMSAEYAKLVAKDAN